MKYICEYKIPVENKENRYFTLSSNDKLDYILSAIFQVEKEIDIISPSHTLHCKGKFKSRKDRLNSNCFVVSGPTFGTHSAIGRMVHKCFTLLWLTIYLLVNCNRNETVFVYHSVFTILPLLIVKKIKKIKIVNEVEEIFYLLENKSTGWRCKLEKSIFRKSEAFIFASKQLESICNKQSKAFIIANGNYSAVPKIIVENKDDEKIKIVYAGLIEKDKVAFKSVDIARYLPEDYEIHIIGYGKEDDVNYLISYIQEVNQISDCKVYYDGLKRGNEYTEYLQGCCFGICPLTEDRNYQEVCFPSKITSYMKNGLHVVTTENQVVRTSEYGPFITYVPAESPLAFADVIKKLKIDELKDSRDVVAELNQRFMKDMVKFLYRILED